MSRPDLLGPRTRSRGNVATLGRLGLGRAVAVAQELGPLEEAALLGMAIEIVPTDEVVRVGVLAGTARPRGPGAAEPQLRVAGDELAHDGALADPTGAGDDDDDRRAPALVVRRGERFEKSLALLFAEPAHTAGVGDADGVHRAARFTCPPRAATQDRRPILARPRRRRPASAAPRLTEPILRLPSLGPSPANLRAWPAPPGVARRWLGRLCPAETVVLSPYERTDR